MRLVQDLLLLACLLFVFNTANAANFTSPVQELWSHIQSALDGVVAVARR